MMCKIEVNIKVTYDRIDGQHIDHQLEKDGCKITSNFIYKT